MKTLIIIMSGLSILDLLFASIFGAWIHSKGSIVVDGTNLLEIHIIQAMGAVVITLVTLGLLIFRKEKKKKIIMIITSLLCMVGLALSWFSGWFLYKHNGIIAASARLFNVHEIQAISSAGLTIILLVFVILREKIRGNKAELEKQYTPHL
ncbi:MAG: hypothetical protein IT308_03910 [Anaerolineaceae bacterium]|nr:hypothetical protein [Anaerolineaceae bacterium]